MLDGFAVADRRAAEAAVRGLVWKYAPRLKLDEPGLDFSVLPGFPARVVAGGAERLALDVPLAALAEEGLGTPVMAKRIDHSP